MELQNSNQKLKFLKCLYLPNGAGINEGMYIYGRRGREGQNHNNNRGKIIKTTILFCYCSLQLLFDNLCTCQLLSLWYSEVKCLLWGAVSVIFNFCNTGATWSMQDMIATALWTSTGCIHTDSALYLVSLFSAPNIIHALLQGHIYEIHTWILIHIYILTHPYIHTYMHMYKQI